MVWVAGEPYYLVGPKGKTFHPENWFEIKNLGVLLGEQTIVQSSLINKYQLNVKLDVSGTTYETLLKKLKLGRIDALCIAKPGLQSYMDQLSISEKELGNKFVIEGQEGYLQFSKQSLNYSPDIIHKLHDGFETLRKKGILDSINQRYLPTLAD